MVWDAVFIQNAETVPYDLYNGFYGNENVLDHGTLHSTNGKLDAFKESVLPKISSCEDIEVENFRAPQRDSKCIFYVFNYPFMAGNHNTCVSHKYLLFD